MNFCSYYNTVLMANNLMRWWRTRFLGSYKPFTVECNDGRSSDTEELIGRNVNNQTSCTTPPLQNQRTNSPSSLPNNDQHTSESQTEHHLNLQEFSCDVSVKGGPDKHNQERQEFSFTLYDFDGHGKITKDDIAGLVTTIYEVLGSSVKVPHYGSKTIKVKLTVSPDQRKHVSATLIDHKNDKSEESNQKSTVRPINNDKVKERQSHHKTVQERKHYCCRKLDKEDEKAADMSEEYSDVCSRVSAEITSDDEEGESFENYRHSKRVQRKRYRYSTPKYTVPNRFTRESSNPNQKDSFLRLKKVKKRSTTIQKQELLDIIQANVEKGNACFQTVRKPYPDHINVDNHLQQSEHKRHRHKSSYISSLPLQYFSNVVDPTHFYVDLKSLHDSSQFSQSNCQYDKLINAVMRVSNNKKLEESKMNMFKKHSRSKSYDLSDTQLQYQVLESVDNMNKPMRRHTHNITDFEASAVKKNVRKLPHAVVGHTSSPHHLRHRNRQEDQARAMAQVVKWLDQEFSSNLNTKDTRDKKQSNWTGHQEKHSCSTSSTPNSTNVERHEHHHVHEHIHHHYHHYQETPVVV